MNKHHENTNNSNSKDCIVCEKCGTVTVSIYKEKTSGSPIFHIQSDNESVLPISDAIEDTLTLY